MSEEETPGLKALVQEAAQEHKSAAQGPNANAETLNGRHAETRRADSKATEHVDTAEVEPGFTLGSSDEGMGVASEDGKDAPPVAAKQAVSVLPSASAAKGDSHQLAVAANPEDTAVPPLHTGAKVSLDTKSQVDPVRTLICGDHHSNTCTVVY